MKKLSLPKIENGNKNYSLPKKTHSFANPFNSLLKKYKLKKLDSERNESVKNNGRYMLTEPSIEPKNKFSDTVRSLLQKEESKLLIKGQKYLIKLYKNDYSSLIDSMKKDIQKSLNKLPKINPEKSANLPSLTIQTEMDTEKKEEKKEEPQNEIEYDLENETLTSESFAQKSKYGFNKFKQSNYVTSSCMRDFYVKYSNYNIFSRKYFVESDTPLLAFIKSTNEEKLIPNPLGLVKRSGDQRKLEYNYQKVGDEYVKALSNSLIYSENFETIDLSGNRLSNDGVNKLFKIINENKKLVRNLKSVNLSENNLGTENLEELILFLKDADNVIEELNLYGNLIGDENTVKICESLSASRECKIILLNLGKNNIHDESVPSICKLLEFCSQIDILNLSHNWFHNKPAAKIISTILNFCPELKILDISWNCIGDDLVIIPSYEELANSQIRHPDKNFDNFALEEALGSLKLNLRRNPFLPPLDEKGGKKEDKNKKNNQAQQDGKEEIKEPKKIPVKPKNPSEFAINLGEFFCKTNTELIHLDISHNNINYIDCKLLSEKVKNNHNILGIHLDGNEMEINALGFIIPIEKNSKGNKYFSESQITYGINNNYSLRKTSIEAIRRIRNKNNCWICDGFREIEFEFKFKVKKENPNNHIVKIHLSFDEYKPFDMIYNEGVYHMARMCPPGNIHYFFTCDTEVIKPEDIEGKAEFKKIGYAKDHINFTFDNEYMEELKNLKERLHYEIKESNNSQNDLDKAKDKEICSSSKNIISINTDKDISISVDTVCKMNIKYNPKIIDENYRKLFKFSVPRPERNLNKFIKPRTPWSFPISIWAYYGYEYNDVPESYLKQCFNFDFERCQFFKDFKTEESLISLKYFLRERYRDIIDCYKYYSSLGGMSVWQITQNNLTEFISHCNDFCNKQYDINNVYLTQKTVCGSLIDKEDRKKKNKNLSDNIVRHQFMNLLVKVSKDKYITILKTISDPLEAVHIAFENHFDNAIKGFNYHKWRQERYYNEKVDNFLKTYLPIFDALYLSWAKQKGPTKKDVWMTLDEFNNLVQSIVDVNEYPIRENPYIFNMSINLQINEIYTDKHLNMLLPEFLEAISRAIDKASPYPPAESKEDWPMEKRQNQHLVEKLENVLPILMKLITHPDFKILRDKFPTPTKDLSTGLYIIDYENQFYQGYIIKVTKKEKPLEINYGEKENENDKEEEKVNDESNKVMNQEEIAKENNVEINKDENNKEEIKKDEKENEAKEEEIKENKNENENNIVKDDKGEIVNENNEKNNE